jgi:hypothetical protein
MVALGGSIRMNTPEPNEQIFNALIAVVAATVTLVGAVLTTVGISAGVITGLLRNDTPLTSLFLVVALVGVLLGVASAFVRPSGRRRRIRWAGGIRGFLALVGVLLLFLGVVLVVSRASTALKTTSRPSISVTVTPLDKPAGYATLEATVTASGVTTHERYYIHAELLNQQQQAANLPVFTTFVGPGADGTLDYTFKVQFPIDPQHPWIAVTAQLSAEGKNLVTTQNCGLPQNPSSPTPPTAGTTCAVARAPTGSASPSPTSTASRSPTPNQ